MAGFYAAALSNLAGAPLARYLSALSTFVCTMAMMAFVALAGPIARVIGLAAWQIGTAVTVAGVAWMVMARVWGGLSDRRGRRSIILFGLAGFAITYFLLSLFIDIALRTEMVPVLAFSGIVIGRGVAGLFYAAVPATSTALVADHVPPEQRAGAMAAFGMGWVYPSVSALAGNSVEAHEQGTAAGLVAAAQGFGIIVGPITGTSVYGLDNGLPYTLIAGMLLIAVLWKPKRCGDSDCDCG